MKLKRFAEKGKKDKSEAEKSNRVKEKDYNKQEHEKVDFKIFFWLTQTPVFTPELFDLFIFNFVYFQISVLQI